MENTNDLSDFGFKELEEAARLLTAYCESAYIRNGMYEGVKLEFNRDSGKVFLVDDDCNVAMMNGNEIEFFFTCFECGYESFESEFEMDNEGNRFCPSCNQTI